MTLAQKAIGPLISASGLTYRRGGRAVLDGVSITVAPGETLVVLGPNGAGKSSLARALLGLGRVQGTIERRDNLQLGYVPQFAQRDPTLPLSTGDYIALGGIRAREASILDALGVAPLLRRPVARLSGGEMRRAALARAMLRAPDLLVLDEPFAGIDAKAQEQICDFLASWQQATGTAILLIAHELLLVLRIAARVVCLDGSIAAEGTARDVAFAPGFARIFGAATAHAAQHMLDLEAKCHDPALAPQPAALAAHG